MSTELNAVIMRRDALLREQHQLANTVGQLRDMLAERFGEEYDSDDDPTVAILLPVLADKASTIADLNDQISKLKRAAAGQSIVQVDRAAAGQSVGQQSVDRAAAGQSVDRAAAGQSVGQSVGQVAQWANVRRLQTGRPGKPALVWAADRTPLTADQKVAYKAYRDAMAAAGRPVEEPPYISEAATGQPGSRSVDRAAAGQSVGQQSVDRAAAGQSIVQVDRAAAGQSVGQSVGQQSVDRAAAGQSVGQPVGRLDKIEATLAQLANALAAIQATAAGQQSVGRSTGPTVSTDPPSPRVQTKPDSRPVGQADRAAAAGQSVGQQSVGQQSVGPRRMPINAKGGSVYTVDVTIDGIRETIRNGYDIRATCTDENGQTEQVSWYHNPAVSTDRTPPVAAGQKVRITGRIEGRHISRKRPQLDGSYAYDVSTPFINPSYDAAY